MSGLHNFIYIDAPLRFWAFMRLEACAVRYIAKPNFLSRGSPTKMVSHIKFADADF